MFLFLGRRPANQQPHLLAAALEVAPKQAEQYVADISRQAVEVAGQLDDQACAELLTVWRVSQILDIKI